MEYRDFRCPWLDKRGIWDFADRVRSEYWPKGTIPVDSESIVEFGLRLDIIPIKGLLSDIDVDAYLRTDLSGIVVDEDRYILDKFRNRLRFSFAHELGHLFLHKEIYQKLDLTTPEDWKIFILTVPEEEYKKCEWQAHEFAGRLLVPRAILEEEVRNAVTKISNHDLSDYLRSDPEIALQFVSPGICKPFGVSDQVIEYRLRREGLWPPRI